MQNKIRIVMDPAQRDEYLKQILMHDGLSHITEDVTAAYCPIVLTSTPPEVKEFVLERQKHLITKVLQPAGITGYDPATAPFAPDTFPHHSPQTIYLEDSAKIAGCRYFVGHNLISSSGQGNEFEKAKYYNRVSVILMDANIRVGRMLPHRTIYLQYAHFSENAPVFVPLFRFLQQYDPGMGFDADTPVLLGFEKKGMGIVNLEKTVYDEFAHLKYTYDPDVPKLEVSATNPQIFYEHK